MVNKVNSYSGNINQLIVANKIFCMLYTNNNSFLTFISTMNVKPSNFVKSSEDDPSCYKSLADFSPFPNVSFRTLCRKIQLPDILFRRTWKIYAWLPIRARSGILIFICFKALRNFLSYFEAMRSKAIKLDIDYSYNIVSYPILYLEFSIIVEKKQTISVWIIRPLFF